MLKNESIAVIVPIPISLEEVEIKSEKEIDHSEESDDEEKFRMAVKRMANAFKLGSKSCDPAKYPWQMERHFRCALGRDDVGQRQARGKTCCRESLKREQDVLTLAEEVRTQGSKDEKQQARNSPSTQTHQKALGSGRDSERIVGRCSVHSAFSQSSVLSSVGHG